MPALIGLGHDALERGGKVIGPRSVEVGPASGGILADEDRIGGECAPARGRPALQEHRGVQVALIVAIEVDLKRAPDVRFVVRGIVERDAIDLHGPVVAGRVPGSMCRRE